MIANFTGTYSFLSNFHPHPMVVGGVEYPTLEHAFQAAKTDDIEDKRRIAALKTPGAAKKAGKKVRLVDNWNETRVGVMEGLLRHKFQDPEMKERLAGTAPEELVEGNTWRDTFWGQCPVGKGHNHLGKLLMKIRDTEG